MPTSVRVDDKTEALLARAALVSGKTKSAVIRAALQQFCTGIIVGGKPVTPYESIKEFIGCAEGPPDLAKHAGRYVRERLRAAHKRRAR